MSQFVKKFLSNESGATAIEYGLIAAGISIAIVLIVGTLGDEIANTFNDVQQALANRG